MKTLSVPTFDHENKFTGYKKVKVKNKIDHADEMKVLNLLPGFPQGYCPALSKITETKEPIEITRFYDVRQRGIKNLKNLFITIEDRSNDDADGNTISIVWSIDDVMEQAKQDEKEITEDQARKVLKMMKDNHDCNYGITWETISAYIDQI
ncbi:MAG TPA: hypothetical protein VIQ23_10050 [Hanamia sp.]